MASYFRLNRNVELSCLYFLESNLSTDWSDVTLVKTFKEVYAKNTNVPIVCVRLADTASVRLEVGSKTLDDRYLIIIDLFARSDGQRLDLGYYIKDKLKDGWTHYDHSHTSGDASSLDRTANGKDFVTEFITDAPVNLEATEEKKDRYRHNISVQVKKST